MSADPLGLTEDVREATARLLVTAHELDDAAVAAPSLLPGWTRGHVLTHIARNANGAVNLLSWARTGVETPQYASWEARVADIEAGAQRPAAVLVEDLAAACEQFSAAVDQMPAQGWSELVRWTSGAEAPAARVVWSRLREVEIHHVDLGCGYAPVNWPEAFTLRMIRALGRDFGDWADGPRVVIRTPEVGHDVVLGEGTTEPVISGPAAAAVAWLIGRSAGEKLTVEPPGALPPVPRWS